VPRVACRGKHVSGISIVSVGS